VLVLPFTPAPLVLNQLTPVAPSKRINVAAAAAYTVAVFATALKNERIFITGYGWDVETSPYTFDGSLLFRVAIGKVPVSSDHNDIVVQHGTPKQPCACAILVNPGKTISLDYKRVAGGSNFVNFALYGFRFPARHDAAVPISDVDSIRNA